MTPPLKKMPAVAAATFLILSILNSLLSTLYQQIHWSNDFGNVLLALFTNSLTLGSTAMIALSMLRGKRDTFAGVSFGLWVLFSLFSLVINLFNGYFRFAGFFSPASNFLATLFMLFLAVVCFSKGKLQLKKHSFVFLIAGCTVAFFVLINMINNLSSYPVDYYYYDSYWDEYYYDWNLYNYYHVIRTFQLFGPFLMMGAYGCMGWAFMESKVQPQQVQYTPPAQPQYTQPQYTQPVHPQYAQPQYTQPVQSQVNYAQLQELKQLKDEGIITLEEFESKKKDLLQL